MNSGYGLRPGQLSLQYCELPGKPSVEVMGFSLPYPDLELEGKQEGGTISKHPKLSQRFKVNFSHETPFVDGY